MIEPEINAENIHYPHTSLVVLENTVNKGGGSCYTLEQIAPIAELCKANNLKLHLDGARLWNALVANNESTKAYGEVFDSISICLSKGLGTPLGSLLLGDFDYIKQGRRLRKVFGGGMRQAGYMAAAGIYALENNIARLEEDHHHAKQIAEALLQKEFIGKMMPVETNILIFEVIDSYTPKEFCDTLRHHDVLCLPISATQVRMVTHLDITKEMVKNLIDVITAL